MAPSDDPPQEWRLFGGMKLFITVHEPGPKREQRRIQVAHIIDYFASGSGARICYDDDRLLDVRETKAEIDALIAQTQRERDRMTIAAQFMAAQLSDKSQVLGYDAAIHHADALLAALDKLGGE